MTRSTPRSGCTILLLACGLMLGCGGDPPQDQNDGGGSDQVAAKDGQAADESSPDAGGNSGTASTGANNSASNSTAPAGANANPNSTGAAPSGNGTGASVSGFSSSPNFNMAEHTAEEAQFANSILRLAQAAQDHTQRGYNDAAIAARNDIVQLVSDHYGEDSWQAQNARLALDHTRQVIDLSPEQRQTYDAINLHDERGQGLTRSGQSAEAIAEFRQATDLAIQLWGPTSHVVGNLKHKEALVQQATQNYPAAEQLFLAAMDVRRQVLSEIHPDYSTSLNALGVLYHRWGKLEQAELALKDAAENARAVWGEGHAEYATAVNNLGMLYNSMRRFDDGIRELTRVVELRRNLSAEPTALYGHGLFNLGSIYYQAQRFEEAKPILEEAMTVLEPTLGRDHEITIMLINNLAMTSMALKDYTRADELLTEVSEKLRTRFGPESNEFAQGRHNLGVLYINQERFGEAEPFVIEALQIREKLNGPNDPGLAAMLEDFAKILRNTNRPAEAERHSARSKSLAALPTGTTRN